MSKNNSEYCEGTMGILKNISISLRKFFLNLSLKLVAKPFVISDQELCEDFLRRASYVIQFLKNSVMLIVNSITKMLTKERKYSDRGESMDLSFRISFKNLL